MGESPPPGGSGSDIIWGKYEKGEYKKRKGKKKKGKVEKKIYIKKLQKEG